MSRFLLLNFEDFGLNQDITKTIQPHTLYCICCLEGNVPLVNLVTCSHSDYLDSFMKPELKPFNQVICYQCHAVLKKIKQFNEQVQESFKLLGTEAFNNKEFHNLKTTHLNIHKAVDVLILPNHHDPDTVLPSINITKHSNNGEQYSSDCIQSDSKNINSNTLKNIHTALDIINKNSENSTIGLLAPLSSTTSDITTKLENAVDILNVSKENAGSKIENVNSVIQKTEPIEDVYVEEMMTENKLLVEIKSEPSEIETPEVAITGLKTESNQELKPNTTYVNTVHLTKEELIQERALLSQSIAYLKHPYKCEKCIIGFNFKENLDDHLNRKHMPKLPSLTCEVCLQVLFPAGSYTAHKFRHYTRYECSSCSKRFNTYDDALSHYRKQHALKQKKHKYKCHICDFGTDNQIILHLHNRKIHNKFPCKRCSVVLDTSKSLKNHITTKHSADKQKISCAQCSLQFSSTLAHNAHMQRKHSYCAKCDMRFKSWYACTTHMRYSVAHADKSKQFTCDSCHMEFSMENQLNRHLVMKHLRKEVYRCKICPEIFTSKLNLGAHSKTHRKKPSTEHENVLCDYCGRAYKSRLHLIKHLKTHFGIENKKIKRKNNK